MKQWPRIGSKVKFKGAHKVFWFKNIVENAEKNLEIGKEYTVSKLHLASSWCGVELEEFGDMEFSLSFFTHEKELTTEEVRSIDIAAQDTETYEFVTLKELKERKNET
jgi:hypothetical protein